MKKKICIILSILCVLAFAGFGIAMLQNKEQDVRETVWNKLSDEEKTWVIGTWSDATQETVVIVSSWREAEKGKEFVGYISFRQGSENYIGKTLYRITFKSTNAISGPYCIYVDPGTKEIVGVGVRA